MSCTLRHVAAQEIPVEAGIVELLDEHTPDRRAAVAEPRELEPRQSFTRLRDHPGPEHGFEGLPRGQRNEL